VAGGLGERLGYGGIKVELPAETTTGASFLQTYATALLAMQEYGDQSKPVQLVIMTSEDTDDKARRRPSQQSAAPLAPAPSAPCLSGCAADAHANA
jgi:UDP-N-acetylglucosamine pyrophosphorylase